MQFRINFVFLAYGNETIGLGHYYRTLALAQEVSCRGHRVTFLSDRPTCQPGVRFEQVAYNDPATFLGWVRPLRPDWVIVDFPEKTPDWARGKWKLMLLDPANPWEQDCDLAVSQGFRGYYTAPEYLILAPELRAIHRPRERERCWFVWGGASDNLGLLELFARNIPQTALLASANGVTPDVQSWNPKHWQGRATNRSEFFRWMSECDRAVIQMGHTAWECLYFGLPLWLISHSERGHKTALQMEKRGWAKVWPNVGPPPGRSIRRWLAEKWQPEPCPIDGQGTERIVKLMEAG